VAQWDGFSAYSCGHSTGFPPVSLFTAPMRGTFANFRRYAPPQALVKRRLNR
jgi:hypothetical protein